MIAIVPDTAEPAARTLLVTRVKAVRELASASADAKSLRSPLAEADKAQAGTWAACERPAGATTNSSRWASLDLPPGNWVNAASFRESRRS